MSISTSAFLLTVACCSAILGCQSADLNSPDAAELGVTAPQAPVEVPFFESLQDVNPCTGGIVTYTFTGTARILEFTGHFILVATGSVVTSDGFSGGFNRQYIIQDDHVAHFRFHDTEISDETGQRIMFALGLFHETLAGGEPVVTLEQFSGLRCVGKGS